MEVVTRHRGNVLVVAITGELDHHTGATLRTIVEQELDKDIASHVLLDLAGLEFMDSSGLGVILGRYKRINAQGGKMAACNLAGAAARLFEVGGLGRILQVFEDETSALQEMKGWGSRHG